MEQAVIAVGFEQSRWQSALVRLDNLAEGDELAVLTAANAKKAVKLLRKNPHTAALLVCVAKAKTAELQSLCRSVREVIHNETLRIIVCAEDDSIASAPFVSELGVNAVVPPGDGAQTRLSSQLQSELRTHALFTRTQARHQAETDLLTAIARFSRLEMKLSECLQELARSIGVITRAACVNVIVVRRDGSLKRSAVCYESSGVDAADFLQTDCRPQDVQLQQVLEEARLQLRIKSDDHEFAEVSNALATPISGRLVFPLRSFGRTMCLVDCWLPSDGLEQVSVELVRLIEKSSEQFSLLFERKQADSQLKRQYKRLKHTLEELTSTKDALYHSEKLASLGQLAAGIAHEINNPVAYVMGNFSPLKEYVDGMRSMLDLHQQFVDSIDNADVQAGHNLRNQINQLGEDLDMEYVMEDVRSLVNESRDGLLRVRDIVVDLSQFARKDTIEAEPTNLNSCIESTLRLLRNELKHGVEVSLALNDIPPVACQAGLINQVLLNLIKNAAQSTDDDGEVHISTDAVQGEFVEVRIKDNGCGIPKDVVERIFEPFFTTKPVGKGTGLGLSLSHGIIERHNGVLEVAETGPDGTEFRLALPLQPDEQPLMDKAA